MIQDDINQFEEMIADCYSVSIGTKRTIEITKQAFESVGVKLSPNNIFYEVKSTKKTEGKLLLVDNKKAWSQSCCPFHVLRPSHCPDCRNEQR